MIYGCKNKIDFYGQIENNLCWPLFFASTKHWKMPKFFFQKKFYTETNETFSRFSGEHNYHDSSIYETHHSAKLHNVRSPCMDDSEACLITSSPTKP